MAALRALDRIERVDLFTVLENCVRGASDIDLFFEIGGRCVFGEFKVVHNPSKLSISYGQFTGMQRVKALNPEKVRYLLLAHTPDLSYWYWIDVENAKGFPTIDFNSGNKTYEFNVTTWNKGSKKDLQKFIGSIYNQYMTLAGRTA